MHLTQHNYRTHQPPSHRSVASSTYLLVALLLPLGNQHRIRVPVLEQPLVQLPADGLLLVVQVVDVARALVRDLENGPCHFVLFLALVRRVLGIFHLVRELEECVFQVFEAFGRAPLAGARSADGWHVGVKGGVDRRVRWLNLGMICERRFAVVAAGSRFGG
jgi:hypothetical protein